MTTDINTEINIQDTHCLAPKWDEAERTASEMKLI